MTTTQSQNCVNATSSSLFKMTPGFILGLFEGDGSLFISIARKPNNVTGYRVRLSWKITLHEKDLAVLHAVKNFLGVGTVERDNASNCFRYVVWNMTDIIKVIAPLLAEHSMVLSKRHNDVVLFLQAVNLVSQGLHNTLEGLSEIRSLNAGLSGKMDKTEKLLLKPTGALITNEWFQGFSMAEGSFYSIVTASATSALGSRVIIAFDISQELCELDAVNRFKLFIGCGSIVQASKQPSLRVQGRADLIKYVIPFFEKYPLLGSKAKRFNLLKDILNIMENNTPLTQINLDQIKDLIKQMKSY